MSENRPMYLAPLRITGYACVLCRKATFHKQGSKLFRKHYAYHANLYGWKEHKPKEESCQANS